jgi:hypothetical protein
MRAKPAVLVLIAGVAGCGCAGLMPRPGATPIRRDSVTATRLVLTAVTLGVFPKVQAEFEAGERRRLAEQRARDAAAQFRRRWLHRILAARDAVALSAAFGGPPRGCRPGAADSQICVWTTEALLVRAVQAGPPPSGRLELPPASITEEQVVIATCEVPAGGGRRDPRRCDVSFW